MGLRKVENTSIENDVKKDLFSIFERADLCSGCHVLVNVSTLIISLVPVDQSGYVIAQRHRDIGGNAYAPSVTE
jgi:hypothetical protein